VKQIRAAQVVFRLLVAMPMVGLLAALPGSSTYASDQVVVGSKIFTESYILSEIAAQALENSSKIHVIRKPGIGSTGMLFESLKSGAIDLYPDYTGTLAETILKQPGLKQLDQIKEALSPLGLTISGSLGFDNTYSIAVEESFAQANGLENLSDLKKIDSKVRSAFSYEFMDRQDGYSGLVKKYGFHFAPDNVKRMEHSLVYRAIHDHAVDLIEVYSTDANIKKFKLHVLKDDLGYFPRYDAVWVARKDFSEHHQAEWKTLLQFENKITEATMISMNASADIDKRPFAEIASQFLGTNRTYDEGMMSEIGRRTQEHLWLVGISLLFSLIIGIPLGIVSAKYRLAGQAVLVFSAVVQTIPTLALLCFLIPVLGVGIKPALTALCLYSLLPVVLNTFTGIRGVDSKHIENAKAFGLSRFQILTRIVLPIASPTILAGVKTATIVSIGTATLAALIGAGGYGALIISGLSLNNMTTILTGAIPAALMALIAYLLFEAVTRLFVPKGLR
jgi:osmoprotectant transport system permease protein